MEGLEQEREDARNVKQLRTAAGVSDEKWETMTANQRAAVLRAGRRTLAGSLALDPDRVDPAGPFGSAVPNQHGVRWATSKDGRLDIACAPNRLPDSWRVWGLYVGTHDLAPIARDFDGPDAEERAREYANQVWAR